MRNPCLVYVEFEFLLLLLIFFFPGKTFTTGLKDNGETLTNVLKFLHKMKHFDLENRPPSATIAFLQSSLIIRQE